MLSDAVGLPVAQFYIDNDAGVVRCGPSTLRNDGSAVGGSRRAAKRNIGPTATIIGALGV